MEFPRMVYRSASLHMGVNSADEHAAALNDGWFATVPDALAGKHSELPKPVTIYRETAGNMETFTAKDAAEADLYIGADGWHTSKAAAVAAAVRADWPQDAASILAIVDGLRGKTKEAMEAYAARIGAKVAKNAKAPDILDAVASRLEAGPDAQ